MLGGAFWGGEDLDIKGDIVIVFSLLRVQF
jgi:hypothetical protein